MNDKVVKLNDSDILRLEIETKDGKKTGEYLEFDLEDIELPLRFEELIEKDKKNKEWLRNQLIIIDKKEDVPGDKLLTRNEKEKLVALKQFFKKEVEIYNMFLGENGVQKLLNGRKLGWTSLQEIDKIIETQIAPYLDISMERITQKVKDKYGEAGENDKEVLK